ncbi:unnamed protein product [[Candida] boidinii]|uniref:Unnamed protein product n=1 Tax=Candida boidinii TaxID=5477 RepID=A0A9W6W8H3_CANBO|nr:unnamed protein product [[Candida] boidinii]GMG10341.1 unnamed protein product [[Candida] boidinii]
MLLRLNPPIRLVIASNPDEGNWGVPEFEKDIFELEFGILVAPNVGVPAGILAVGKLKVLCKSGKLGAPPNPFKKLLLVF